MERKSKSIFSASPGIEDPLKNDENEKTAKDKPNPKKTSYDPLYDTTDRYRKVCKPMDVEDFLSAER